MRWNHARRTCRSPSCGVVSTHLSNGITPVLKAPPGVLTCFNTAVRECQAASIAVNEGAGWTETPDAAVP
jgi:hypothetical protein